MEDDGAGAAALANVESGDPSAIGMATTQLQVQHNSQEAALLVEHEQLPQQAQAAVIMRDQRHTHITNLGAHITKGNRLTN